MCLHNIYTEQKNQLAQPNKITRETTSEDLGYEKAGITIWNKCYIYTQ